MEYRNICAGIFEKRPNRFIAEVDIRGSKEKAHVKNTGRCKELLVSGAEVCLEDHAGRMGTRKLRYSLISVKKGDRLVNIDSQAPNKAVKEALEQGKIVLPQMGELSLVKGEQTFGSSRFDFYTEDCSGKRAFIEVKGVTLEEDGVAKFPDAPTERGVKHIEELIKAVESGYLGYVIFVIQMKGVDRFRPNDKTHRAFGDALRKAARNGVGVLAYDCRVTETEMTLDSSVSVEL